MLYEFGRMLKILFFPNFDLMLHTVISDPYPNPHSRNLVQYLLDTNSYVSQLPYPSDHRRDVTVRYLGTVSRYRTLRR